MIAILLLAVGFAAISTTLIINGSTSIGENADDFSVIFTAASLDGTDVYANVIDDTKKIITFKTSDLKTLNQTSVLTYEVTNNSSNYDAEVQVNCKVKNDAEAKYTSIKNELANNATKVKAKETLNGTLTVTLNKTATEEVTEEYVCELTFNAVERDTIGVQYNYYYAYGTPTVSSTMDYTTIGKNVFARLGSDESKAACIIDNNLFCIKSNDYDNSKLALKEHFEESNCVDNPSSLSCDSDFHHCTVDKLGGVSCYNKPDGDGCYIYSNGSIECK